jgi:hypothetical protein
LSVSDVPLKSGIAIVVAVNNDVILAANLLRSPMVARGEVPVYCYRGCASVGEAYGRGLSETTAEIVVFAHQDVYIPDSWLASFRQAEAHLAERDPDWAILGPFGVSKEGTYIGHVWSTGIGRMLGQAFVEPLPTVAIDELLIVLRRASGLRFDPALPGFHLYGTDIVRQAMAAGKGAWVVHMPVIHNSRPVRRLGPDYARALAYMRRKWAAILPLPTLIVPVTRTPWPLWKLRLRRWLHPRRKTITTATRDPAVLAAEQGLE